MIFFYLQHKGGSISDTDLITFRDKRYRQQTIFFGVNDEDEDDDEFEVGWGEMLNQHSKNSNQSDDEEEEEESDDDENDVDRWIKDNGSKVTMIGMLMQLRKCVNHPYVFRSNYTINEKFVECSGKLRVMDAMLKKLFADPAKGHKVIIYSQFVMVLDVLAEYCDLREVCLNKFSFNFNFNVNIFIAVEICTN